LALLHHAAPAVMNVLHSAGLNTISPDLTPMPVSVDAWLASPASEGWRLLWLTCRKPQTISDRRAGRSGR
ncbi:hypothetical protein EGM92_35360, partial [Enterobacter cloacae]